MQANATVKQFDERCLCAPRTTTPTTAASATAAYARASSLDPARSDAWISGLRRVDAPARHAPRHRLLRNCVLHLCQTQSYIGSVLFAARQTSVTRARRVTVLATRCRPQLLRSHRRFFPPIIAEVQKLETATVGVKRCRASTQSPSIPTRLNAADVFHAETCVHLLKNLKGTDTEGDVL